MVTDHVFDIDDVLFGVVYFYLVLIDFISTLEDLNQVLLNVLDVILECFHELVNLKVYPEVSLLDAFKLFF